MAWSCACPVAQRHRDALGKFELQWGVRSVVEVRRSQRDGPPGIGLFGVEEVLERERVPDGTEFDLLTGSYAVFDGTVLGTLDQSFVCASETACTGLDEGIEDMQVACLRMRYDHALDRILIVGPGSACDSPLADVTAHSSLR